MNRIAHQIVDDHSGAAYPKTVVHKFQYLLRLQVMSKETATHQIETSVREGKCERISGHRQSSISSAVFQMRMGAVQQCDLKMNPRLQQACARSLRHISSARGNF